MAIEAGFFSVESPNELRMIEEYRKEGWRIFILPHWIFSKDKFFNAVRDILPLNPPLKNNRNWGALLDSLWFGLDALADEKILIVWPDFSFWVDVASREADGALSVLSQAQLLSCQKTTTGPAKQVAVIQVV